MLSMFSGAGGLDVGLEVAGFETVGCLEIDPTAQETLRQNRPDWPLLLDGDVLRAATNLTPADLGLEIGELDLLAGGPPCQPFSMAAQWSGEKKGMDDERAATVHGLLDLIEAFLPKAVLLENVLGFVQGKKSALPAIEARLLALRLKTGRDYKLHWKLVNAADYGVPQNRRRVILVILRDGFKWSWPEVTHAHSPITTWMALSGLPKEKTYTPAKGKWASLLPSIPAGTNYQWLTASGGGVELFGYRTKYWNFLLKLDPDQPSWTLPASPGPSTGPFHWDNRPLTPRECMRLQSFPDSWKLAGDARTQIKQLGNATPPRLSWVFGRAIASSLGYKSTEVLPLPEPGNRRRRIPRPRPVPNTFLSSIGEKPPHPGHGRGPAGAITRSSKAPDVIQESAKA